MVMTVLEGMVKGEQNEGVCAKLVTLVTGPPPPPAITEVEGLIGTTMSALLPGLNVHDRVVLPFEPVNELPTPKMVPLFVVHL